MLDERTGRCAFCGAGGAGAGGGEKKGAVIHCNRGGPSTVSNGIASNKLRPSACIANDASVVHPRRAERSQVVSRLSNMLPDMLFPDMLSSRRAPLPVQTPASRNLI